MKFENLEEAWVLVHFKAPQVILIRSSMSSQPWEMICVAKDKDY